MNFIPKIIHLRHSLSLSDNSLKVLHVLYLCSLIFDLILQKAVKTILHSFGLIDFDFNLLFFSENKFQLYQDPYNNSRLNRSLIPNTITIVK